MNHDKIVVLYFLLLIPIVFFMAGCRTHQGEIGWVDQAPSPPQSYIVRDTVTAEASTAVFFGFSSNTWNVYDRARRNLLEKANLGANERIISRTLDETSLSFLPIDGTGFLTPLFSLFRMYHRKTVYLSGEIIREQKRGVSRRR